MPPAVVVGGFSDEADSRRSSGLKRGPKILVPASQPLWKKAKPFEEAAKPMPASLAGHIGRPAMRAQARAEGRKDGLDARMDPGPESLGPKDDDRAASRAPKPLDPECTGKAMKIPGNVAVAPELALLALRASTRTLPLEFLAPAG